MKEAAGEANMTVITIILIGVIAAVAVPLVNNAMKGIKNQSCCNSAGGTWSGSTCDHLSTSGQTAYSTCLTSTGNN